MPAACALTGEMPEALNAIYYVVGLIKKGSPVSRWPPALSRPVAKAKTGHYIKDSGFSRGCGTILVTLVERRSLLSLNENTNGLIRQYLPKGTDFNKLTDRQVLEIMDKLNNRPRKCLGYKTPNQVFFGINPPVALAS